MSYQIYIFHLRTYLKIGGVNECIWREGIDVESSHYNDVVILAKKEFVRLEPPLKGFTDWDLG